VSMADPLIRPRVDRTQRPGDDLAALVAAIVDLRQRVERLEVRRRPDPDRDGHLLSTIARVFGRSIFTIANLHDSPDPQLHAVVAGVSVRELGSWLRRLRRHPVAPYAISWVARASGGRVWTIEVDR